MTFDEVLTTVTAELTKMAAKIGYPVDGALRPEMKPIGDLGMFDSLNGIEITVALEQKFGVTLSENVFVVNDGGRMRAASIFDVATSIYKALGQQKAKV